MDTKCGDYNDNVVKEALRKLLEMEPLGFRLKSIHSCTLKMMAQRCFHCSLGDLPELTNIVDILKVVNLPVTYQERFGTRMFTLAHLIDPNDYPLIPCYPFSTLDLNDLFSVSFCKSNK